MCLFLIRIQPKNSKQAAIFYKGGGGGGSSNLSLKYFYMYMLNTLWFLCIKILTYTVVDCDEPMQSYATY